MKRFLFVFLVAVVFFMMNFMLPWNTAEVSAKDSMRINERKFFTTYVVEKDDTLWDIANNYMTDEYDSIYEYINEVMESNHLENTNIKYGQMLILPYYADAPTL
jgi:nucleoid-associated protein YgaU